jgi:putative transposase
VLTLWGRAGKLMAWHDWREFLTEALGADEAELLRHHERTGRPLGETAFLDRIEQTLHRVVRPAKRGRKPTQK